MSRATIILRGNEDRLRASVGAAGAEPDAR